MKMETTKYFKNRDKLDIIYNFYIKKEMMYCAPHK